MTKTNLTIIIISLAFVLFSCAGESKDENSDFVTETPVSDRMTSEEISEELEEHTTKLTAEQKEAFQLRAIQKFQDFVDYLKIISDPNVDNSLKEHSSQLALELFVSDSTFISDSIRGNSLNNVLLKDYINKMKSRKKPFSISIQNIQFSKPLELDSLNTYRGIIQASLTIKKITLTKSIEIYLVEIEKKFGDNTQNINEVRLGNIY